MTFKTQGCFLVSSAGDGSERVRRGWQTSERGLGSIVLALLVIWFLLQQRIPRQTECAESRCTGYHCLINLAEVFIMAISKGPEERTPSR